MTIHGMDSRTVRWLAQGVIAMSLGLTLVASGLLFAAQHDNIWFMLPMLAIPIAGAVIIERRPDNCVGQLLVLFGVLLMVSNSADAWARFSTVVYELPGATWAAWFSGFAFKVVILSLFPLIFLLFPNGHLVSPRWRRALWIVIAVVVMLAGSSAFLPGPVSDADELSSISNPLGVEALAGILKVIEGIASVSLLLLIIVSLASLVVRFRSSRGIERRQLKWFVWTAVLAFAALLYSNVLSLVIGDSVEADLLVLAFVIAAAVGIPASIALAIIQYRLYDIDRLNARTMGIGSLTILLTGLYVALVVGVGRVVQYVTGTVSQLVIAASTLMVAALFQPARLRVQAVVDERFYRRRYDAEQAKERFSHSLRDELDLSALSNQLRHVVQDAM